jgi:hypothetical protein
MGPPLLSMGSFAPHAAVAQASAPSAMEHNVEARGLARERNNVEARGFARERNDIEARGLASEHNNLEASDISVSSMASRPSYRADVDVRKR